MLLLFCFITALSLIFVCGLYVFFLIKKLPSVQHLKAYHPPLLSVVLDRKGQKVGEFFKERRFLVPYQEFPEVLIHAFVSAEDGHFFEHKGLNVKAIFRAFLANLRAGKKVQGGSTITQQVARSLLLSSKKTYKRKFKEAILALRIEKHFSKQEILYLYLNQIYLGHGAYGVGMAGEIYFRKKAQDLSLAESAMLAGLPQAPSRFSPIYNSKKAKERQIYTLNRMVEENYIDQQTATTTGAQPLKVFLREKYHEKAPYYMETLRQSLLQKIEETQLLTGGLTIKSAMELSLQKMGRESLKTGLRDLDKRQGWRGRLQNIQKEEDIKLFFEQKEKALVEKRREFRIIMPLNPTTITANQKNTEEKELRTIKTKEIIHALVREVNDQNKKVLLELPFKNYGLLPLENMKWARTPDPSTSSRFFSLKKPSVALKKGDVVLVQVEKEIEKEECIKTTNWQYTKKHKIPFMPKQKNSLQVEHIETTHSKSKTLWQKKTPINCGFWLSLEQEPLVEGALIAFDQKTGDIMALVGGYDFERSQFNRAYQATRQTGSVFKPLVYLSALDKGWTPATIITDTPVVYEKESAEENQRENQNQENNMEIEEEEENKTWKPDNYGRRFSGDILFRNALIRSMNVPTVKIIESVGIPWVKSYAKRLGIFSPLNPDYTLALGSSSVTLYEMTKAFAIIGRLGKTIKPLLLHEVIDTKNHRLLGTLSLDERFAEQRADYEQSIEEKRKEFLAFKNTNKDINVPTFTGQDKNTKDTDTDKKRTKNKISFFFADPEQLISKQNAFIMTTLLQAVIQDPHGTGGRAREMDWPLAGKTGTTNGYYDSWFIGFSPQMAVGVWVGFDDEKSLGHGETGARSALPIWLDFMQKAHLDMEKEDFEIPEGIVWTHIDNKTGKWVSSVSTDIVQQAFIEGTQPQEEEESPDETIEDQKFLREDFAE